MGRAGVQRGSVRRQLERAAVSLEPSYKGRTTEVIGTGRDLAGRASQAFEASPQVLAGAADTGTIEYRLTYY